MAAEMSCFQKDWE